MIPLLDSYKFAPADLYDPDAQAMFDARAALGDEPGTPYKQAISNYVTAIKASGLWNNISQLLVFAGATTVASGLVPIKGLTPTHLNLSASDFNIKTGVKGNTTNRRIVTGYDQNSFLRSNMHTYGLVTEAPTNGATGGMIYGNGATSSGAWNIIINTTSGNTLLRGRNTTGNVVANTSLGGYGMSRSNDTSFTGLVADSVSTQTRAVTNVNASPYYLLCTSANGSTNSSFHSDVRLLVWAIGVAATLADYVVPGQNLQTALNAI